MGIFTIIVIILFVLAILFSILYTNDIWYEFTIFFCQILWFIFVVAGAIWLVLISRKAELKNGSDYTRMNNSIFEIRSIIGYGESNYVVKDNTYYTKLIDEVEDYNRYIDKELGDYEFYGVVVPERFLSYQKMIYNYNDNTVTWEDGTSIMIEVKEV